MKSGPYIDGQYKGSSKADYVDEPYWGNLTITIKNGNIQTVDFEVVDSSKNEIFSEKYERHFEGNEVYMQQCREDWKGIQTYPAKLVEQQDIEKVDAVSGATWSYNILKAATEEALKFAKK